MTLSYAELLRALLPETALVEHAHHAHDLTPITWPEKAGAMLLIAAMVYVGLNPDSLLDWIRPALESPLMRAALTGGAS